MDYSIIILKEIYPIMKIYIAKCFLISKFIFSSKFTHHRYYIFN